MDDKEHSSSAVPPDGRLPLTPEQVCRDYSGQVYHLARRMLGSDADAEDVTQDVLLQMVRKLGTFRGESSFPTWLHRVTVNMAQAHRRKRAAQEEHRTRDPLESFLDNGAHGAPVRQWSTPPDEEAMDAETQQLIEEAIRRLPVAYRDIFVLADVEQLPNAEIASIMGLSISTVKSRLHRARLMMRDALAPHFEEIAP